MKISTNWCHDFLLWKQPFSLKEKHLSLGFKGLKVFGHPPVVNICHLSLGGRGKNCYIKIGFVWKISTSLSDPMYREKQRGPTTEPCGTPCTCVKLLWVSLSTSHVNINWWWRIEMISMLILTDNFFLAQIEKSWLFRVPGQQWNESISRLKTSQLFSESEVPLWIAFSFVCVCVCECAVLKCDWFGPLRMWIWISKQRLWTRQMHAVSFSFYVITHIYELAGDLNHDHDHAAIRPICPDWELRASGGMLMLLTITF